MKIKGINFEEDILSAQREETLVVFAGAGVSKNQPSKLKTFEGLVEDIQKWSGIERNEQKQSLEQYLGLLVKDQISVHNQVKLMFSSSGSRHNALHENILSIFSNPDKVRIVTTNYDRHFEEAADKVFGTSPDIYIAPALPVGNDFSGIVYLHGNVTQDPQKLVLTDQDFGRAYLTEGWATRFLQAMFMKYTVLFIGYSHEDTIMQYLAMGLTPEAIKPRFSLVQENTDIKKWNYLGVTPLQYSSQNDEDHSQLIIAMAGWSEWKNRGVLDNEQRIKTIVTGLAPYDEEIKDYLIWAVKNEITCRFFTRYAESPDWLTWADENGCLVNLFNQRDLTKAEIQLAAWVAANFTIKYSDIVFSILQSHGNKINKCFKVEIIRALKENKSQLEQMVISKWITVLLADKSNHYAYEFVEMFKICTSLGANIAAAQIFDYLTKPFLNLKKGIPWAWNESGPESLPEVEVEIVFNGDYRTYIKIWEENIKPEIGQLIHYFWPVITHNLFFAYQLLSSWNKASEKWDALSWRRSAIEKHEQDQYLHVIDFIIDVARDCLDWAINNDPKIGLSWIESLLVMESLILKRLSIYGMSKIQTLTADDKIKWIIEKNILFEYGLKHEMYHLLKDAYPEATPIIRETLIDNYDDIANDLILEEIDKKARIDYERYNFFFWLSNIEPNCQCVENRLKSIIKLYPQFKPRENPDLNYWITGASWAEPMSPKSVEELLNKKPLEWKEYFVSYKGNEFEGPDREGLLYNISIAVQNNYTWSEELASLLLKGIEPSCDIWQSLFRGWQASDLNEKQWAYVLFVIDNDLLIETHYHDISRLVKFGVGKNKNPIPLSLLCKADKVALKTWGYIEKKSDDPINNDKQILSQEIAQTSETLTQFWLKALSSVLIENKQEIKKLPSLFNNRFTMIKTGEKVISNIGRKVLATHIHFIYSVDQVWARENLIPLFDWVHDKEQAEQAWSAWLLGGKLSASLLDEIFPHFLSFLAYRKLGNTLISDRIAYWVASISMFWLDDPIGGKLIQKYFQNSEESERIKFADYVNMNLRSISTEAKKNLWKRWLKRYWENRIDGVPIPLNDPEIREMIEWAPHLRELFSEVVTLILKNDAPKFEHTFFLDQINNEVEFLKNHYPDDLTKLLIHITNDRDLPSFFCEYLEQITKELIDSKAPTNMLKSLVENLAAIGCSRALEFNHIIVNKEDNVNE